MNDRLLRRLQRHLRDGRLVIFAGAGVSAPHVPTWPRLTEFLFEEAEAHQVDPTVLEEARAHLLARRYPDALSAIERAIGGPQFRAAMQEALDTEEVEPTDAARAIRALSPDLHAVVTTNLDTLLERAFEGSWPPMTQATGNLGAQRHYIWKIHGTLPDPHTWVMTREQYTRIIGGAPEHRVAFATLCNSHHFLFVGFGMADGDLDDSLEELHRWFGVTMNTHYALMPTGAVSPGRIEQLRKWGVTCILYGNADGAHREVPEFLHALNPAQPAGASTHHVEPGSATSPLAGSTPGFIGRAFLFDRVRTFVEQNKSGYLFLTGDPGIGKTWFAREFIQRSQAIFHFNSRPDHVSSTESFLGNVCRQLAIRAGDGSLVPPAPTVSDFEQLLERAARHVHPAPLVVVVDALDEADPPAAPGGNRLKLPTKVPEGCFLVVTSRRFDEANPAPRVDRSVIVDIGEDPQHREDARKFIDQFVTDHEIAFGNRFAAWGVDRAAFIEQVLDRSEANFMYLSMVLPALVDGTLSPSAMHSLDALPMSLTEYYWHHWRHMEHAAGGRFPEEERVIYLLACAREPLTVGVMARTLGLKVLTIRAVLRRWQQFLRKSRGSAAEPVWSIYHATFQEFLREHVGFAEVQQDLIEEGIAGFEQLIRGESLPLPS